MVLDSELEVGTLAPTKREDTARTEYTTYMPTIGYVLGRPWAPYRCSATCGGVVGLVAIHEIA